MGKSSLGRVLDRSALDACEGQRARLRVGVPAAWLAEGAILVVTAPARLSCARCDGGGCDGCARSGALRAPAEAGERVVRASLSPRPEGSDAAAERLPPPALVVLRISHPFGPGHGIRQLLLEVSTAEAASPGVARLAPPEPQASGLSRWPGSRGFPARLPWPILALAAAATILWAIFGR